MSRRWVFALGGVAFIAIAVGAHLLPLGLLEPQAWLSRFGPLALIVAVAGVLGVVLVVLTLREVARGGRRRPLPLAGEERRAEDVPPGSWEVADVASELVRRLRGTRRTVHLEGDRIEVMWEDDALAIHRCELVAVGEGVLQHTDSIETAAARSRRADGTVCWEGREPRRAGARLGHDYSTARRNAVHRVVDATLESAGWRRRG